jgi:acyl-CoA thioesterase FadM
VVALAFDEVLGIANIVNGSPGMTATLTVRYRRPMPLLADVRFVAWVERVDGRRIVSHAEAWNGETRCAEAEGLFVQPRPEIAAQYFGPRPGS